MGQTTAIHSASLTPGQVELQQQQCGEIASGAPGCEPRVEGFITICLVQRFEWTNKKCLLKAEECYRAWCGLKIYSKPVQNAQYLWWYQEYNFFVLTERIKILDYHHNAIAWQTGAASIRSSAVLADLTRLKPSFVFFCVFFFSPCQWDGWYLQGRNAEWTGKSMFWAPKSHRGVILFHDNPFKGYWEVDRN